MFLACFRCFDQDESEAYVARIYCVKALVEASANVNYQKPNTQLTPLHWACFNGDKEVVKYLLSKGAEQKMSKLNQTPLGIAGVSQHSHIVACILDHWWKLNQSNSIDGATNDFRVLSNNSEAIPIKMTTGNLMEKSSRVQPDERRNDDDERDNVFGDLEGKSAAIKLKYDTPSNSRKFEQQLNFRILYWAAFIGRGDIVEKIIRSGYSPFVEAHDKKSAVFGAVEGDQPEMLKLILSFSFHPTDDEAFKRS